MGGCLCKQSQYPSFRVSDSSDCGKMTVTETDLI